MPDNDLERDLKKDLEKGLSGEERPMSDLLSRCRIVLINTSHPGNIGAAARAMRNMGLRRLYLVGPRNFPAKEANSRAASAVDVLENAVVCKDLDEALQGADFILGTSARSRRIPWPLVNPREAAVQLQVQVQSEREIAILFGREDRGLTNEELQRCNAHIHIPTDDEYSSLNLGMAVQLIAYELRMAYLGMQQGLEGEPVEIKTELEWDSPWADDAEKQRFYAHLEQVLFDLEFLDPAAPRQLMTRFKRLFARTDLDQMEVNILRGVLTAVQKKTVKSPKKG